MANIFEGLGSEWYGDEVLRQLGAETHRLVVRAEGCPMAVDDRWHSVHNRAVIEPIIVRMRGAFDMRTPYLDELEPEIETFHLLVQTQGKLDRENPPQLHVDDVAIHCCAAGIKKILRFTRKHFLRPHHPRDRCF